MAENSGSGVVVGPSYWRVPDSWEWLDALAGELDDDFVSAVREQPAPTERPSLARGGNWEWVQGDSYVVGGEGIVGELHLRDLNHAASWHVVWKARNWRERLEADATCHSALTLPRSPRSALAAPWFD
jgi:hypothetical protein